MPAPSFTNCYQDATRAEAYSKLEFAGTYLLAYRDLPDIFRAHICGNKALDFGCGTGRSSRFLRQYGFDVVGLDISADMIVKAREFDPRGDYRLVADGDFQQLAGQSFDLVLAEFTFDNIPTEKKVALLSRLAGLLYSKGKLVMVVSSPEIYLNEWASFSTRDFVAQNSLAKSGDVVRIIVTDHEDRRPVEDILCRDETYQEIVHQSGLRIVQVYKPLATGSEPFSWVSETRIAPWVIYVLEQRR